MTGLAASCLLLSLNISELTDPKSWPDFMKPEPESRMSASILPGILCGLFLCITGIYVFASLPGVSDPTGAFHRVARDCGYLAVGTGCTILMAGMVCFFSHTPPDRTQARVGRSLLCISLVAGCVIFLNRLLHTKTASIDGMRFFWLDDDMMISMRYAANLAAGFGAVWNPGEMPVEGYTNPLWMLTMALPHLAGIPVSMTSFFILVLNGVLFLFLLFLTWKTASQAGLGPMIAGWIVLMLALNRWVIYWAVGGSEALLMSCLIMILSLRMMMARRHRPVGWGSGLLLGLLGVARSDALVAVAVLLMAWFSLSRAGRARPWSWLPALLFPAVLFLVRHHYYGEWLPNTYYLRMVDIPTRVMFGLFYGSHFMLLFGGLVATALASICIQKRIINRWLAILSPVILIYAMYAGGDELAEYRFFVPVIPLILIYSVSLLERVVKRWKKRDRLHMLNGFVVIVLMTGMMGFRSLALPGELVELGRVRCEQEHGNLLIGLMLKKHTREDARIAHFWSGAAPYFSERPSLDMLGKNDEFIARLASGPSDFQPAHNKYDAGYSLGLKPDIVVSGINGKIVLDPDKLNGLPLKTIYPGLVIPLEHELFQRYYLSGVIRQPISMDYHGIFLREGSHRVDKPGSWIEPQGDRGWLK
jgi:arabinofuranosyltransferase